MRNVEASANWRHAAVSSTTAAIVDRSRRETQAIEPITSKYATGQKNRPLDRNEWNNLGTRARCATWKVPLKTTFESAKRVSHNAIASSPTCRAYVRRGIRLEMLKRLMAQRNRTPNPRY